MNQPQPPWPGERPLSSLLREAAAELGSRQPPVALAARVQAAVQTAIRPAPPPPRGRWHGVAWAGGGVLALAVVVMGSALLVLRPPPPAVVDDGLRFGGFVRVAPPERWPTGSAQAWLVSTELPPERLVALGLPYDPARAADPVRAELLMRASGEVLAVRFVP
ncbi:MAG: hypothetical protein JNM33_07805 [Rubrivivax sp.]|nr:hypothetical protein [Rubrivivax sp.]